VNDPVLDAYLEGIKFGTTQASVKQNTWDAQARMASEAEVVPVWVASAPKAVRAQYTGGTNEAAVSPDDGENQYRGKDWQGFANLFGNGLNSWFGTLGCHVNNASGQPMYGGVLRYGFKVSEINSFNPVYSEWVWDWEILGRAYETMFAVNPYDLSQDLEWAAKRWDIAIWSPTPGTEATMMRFELRDDIYWHDGQKFTADDVIFTLQDLAPTLEARDLPPPWYYGSLLDINSITKVDEYTILVKMNSKSYFALHWVGGTIILPEHIWRPIVEDGDPSVFAPDPQMIGAGPFKAYPHSIDQTANDYYVPQQYVKLDTYQRNSKQDEIASNNRGYFNEDAIRIVKAVHGDDIVVTLENFAEVPITVNPVTLKVGSTTLPTQGPFVVPKSTGTGNVPGLAYVTFDVSGISPGQYTVKATAQYTFEGKTWLSNDPFVAYVPGKSGDINRDYSVDVLDAITLSLHFGMSSYTWPECDNNADGLINLDDVLLQIGYWVL